MPRIAVVVGTTRPGRKAEAVARWVLGLAGARGDAGGGPSLWCQAALCVLARAM